MIFLKFLFLCNFLFIGFNAFILIRYYILSSKLFILSGLLFFKFLLRLFIYNTFLYFVFNLGISQIKSPSKHVKEMVVVARDFEREGVNDTQINAIKNNVQKQEPGLVYSLFIFNPLTNSLGVLIPKTKDKVFLNFIDNIDFKKARPIYYFKYLPSNLYALKLNTESVLVKNKNELIDLETTNNNLLIIGENWFSINQLSIYLLILLLFLLVVDISFKFQVLK